MSEENPDPQTQEVHDVNVHTEQESAAPQKEEAEETVPLKVLMEQKRKYKELKQELEFYRTQQQQKPPEEDYSRYESVTREELGKTQFETIRQVREMDWAERNPEKMRIIEQELEDFLKTRPNLAHAIQSSTNRYQEAWDLLSALSPKQREREKEKAKALAAPKKEAPMSPGTIPKAAAMNEAVDLMTMSDDDFIKWRRSVAKRR